MCSWIILRNEEYFFLYVKHTFFDENLQKNPQLFQKSNSTILLNLHLQTEYFRNYWAIFRNEVISEILENWDGCIWGFKEVDNRVLFPEIGQRDGAVYWTKRFSDIPEGLLSDLAWHSMQNIIVHRSSFLQIKEILPFKAVKSNGFRNMCVTWGKRQVAPHCMISGMSLWVWQNAM